MANGTKGIFISYRHDESAAHAALLAVNLVEHFGEDRVFRDIDTLEPGIEFAEAIDKAVSSSAVLIAVIGPNWSTAKDETSQKRLENPDDWVRREIATALQRNLRVIPLLVQGAAMPSADELPDDLAPLTLRHAFPLHDSTWREGVQRLRPTLEKVLESRPGPARDEALEAELTRIRTDVEEAERSREMPASTRPVTSREYKLMLNMDRFKDRKQASHEFLSLLDFLVRKERGSVVEKQNGEERRQTSYLDTPEGALRQHGFALRLREEDVALEASQINLKYRASDRYISAAQDLSSPQEGKTKFEEDILPPFVSKFSHSTSIETDTAPELGTMNKVMALFPGLRDLDIDENTPVETVNNFKALEVVRNLCKLEFGEPPIIKASLSFWYLTGGEDEWPLVGEFSFDYDVLDSEADREKVEMYPHRVVEGANRLFNALQKQEGWISFSTTTKTAFALEGL
jgi:hypothetical protein